MSAYETIIGFLTRRKRSYQLVFNSIHPDVRVVLTDLARFCRANETCVVPGNNDATKILEGRREVWLRIANHLNLPPETLYEIFNGKGDTK